MAWMVRCPHRLHLLADSAPSLLCVSCTERCAGQGGPATVLLRFQLCLLLNQWGLIVGWACATANVADNTFQWLIQQVDGRMIVLSDTGFHAADGDPANLKLCQRGAWEDRMLVETVLSMLTVVCHLKKVMHRA